MTLVIQREIARFFKTWLGYIVMAKILLAVGLLYNAFALGGTPKFSKDVLRDFFYLASGATMIVSLFVSMRSFAEERQVGTYPLLRASPLSDGQMVVAKFLAAWLFVIFFIALTLHLPCLVYAKGSVSVGRIVAGYIGLIALGGASTAIGVFGSAVARSQILAIILSTVILVILLTMWMLSKTVTGPLGELISYLALHNMHFRPFMDGTLGWSHLLYYASVIALFLTLARNFLEAERWTS